MKYIVVVGAVIVKEDRILCVQRGPDKSLPYKWEFPGGKIEQGESPALALRREIQEELKCEIEVGQQVEDTVYEYPFGKIRLMTFYCQLIEGEPKLSEHVDMRWLLKDELMSLDWAPADIPAVKMITQQGW